MNPHSPRHDPRSLHPQEDMGETQSLLQRHQEFGWLLGALGPRAEALWACGEKLAQNQHPAAHK